MNILIPGYDIDGGLVGRSSLDADSFSRLAIGVQCVFITENETNFLAFPPVRHALVIFGAGYGWDALARSHWLKHCPIHYWGDIDTHGFGILDQLRGHFDHVASFLMDRATLDAHADFWGQEDKPLRVNLDRLTPEERAVCGIDEGTVRLSIGLEGLDELRADLAQALAQAAVTSRP